MPGFLRAIRKAKHSRKGGREIVLFVELWLTVRDNERRWLDASEESPRRAPDRSEMNGQGPYPTSPPRDGP